MKWLKQTVNECLRVKADGSGKIRWGADAAFAVHPDFKSQTGATMTMGEGSMISMSSKQKLNTRSSTEAELVAADDVMGPMLWVRLFLEAQGYPVKENVLLQDNQSAILLESNGRRSAGKRSRHLNVRYFFIEDQKKKGNVKIEFCPTDAMTADYFTKLLVGKKFGKLRREIVGQPKTLASQLLMLALADKF